MSQARSSLRSTRLQVFYLLLLIIFGAPAFVIAKWLSLESGDKSYASN